MAYGLHYKLCRQSVAAMEEASYGKAAREVHAGLMGFLSTPLNLTAPILYSMAVLEGVASAVTGRKPQLGKIISDRSLQLLPKDFGIAIEKLWGFASERVRHFSKGSPTTDQAEAKLTFSVACATCTFLLKKKDRPSMPKKEEREEKTWLQLKNYGHNNPYVYTGEIGKLVDVLSDDFEIPDEIDMDIVSDTGRAKKLAEIYKSVIEMYSVQPNNTYGTDDAAKIIEDSATLLLEPNIKKPKHGIDKSFLHQLGIPVPLNKTIEGIWKHAKSMKKTADAAELELVVNVSCAVALFLLAPFVDS